MEKDQKDSAGKLKSLIKYLAITGGREKVFLCIHVAVSFGSIFLQIFSHQICRTV